MKIGAIYPHLEIGSDPAVIRDWAQAAEELGYAHILAYDHVLGAEHANREPALWGPYTEDSEFHEPFVLFGFFAAATQRVELVTGVLILPQRQTALVAKQTATLDMLCGGRLRLGVGTGWNYVEYDSLNENFKNRGKRQEEQVEVLRELWAKPVIDYEGEYHRIERAGIKPLPGRQIPIWFGGFNEVAFERAARIGDGFIFGGPHEDSLAIVPKLRALLTEQGREPAAFGLEAMLNYQSGPDNWRREAEAWKSVGAAYISMRGMALRGSDGMSPQQHIDALASWWKAVGDLAD